MCSMKVRVASTPVAPRRWRALNSWRSPVKRRVTSITGSPSLGEGGNGERLNDRVIIGVRDGQCNRLFGVGGQAVIDAEHENPIALEFPADHLVDQLPAAVAGAGGGLG